MFRAVILDGAHLGRIITLPDVMPTIKMPRVSRCTVLEPRWHPADLMHSIQHVTTYELAFLSVDRTIGLFSLRGDPSAILSQRGWIVTATSLERPLNIVRDDHEQPLSSEVEQPTFTNAIAGESQQRGVRGKD
jgi:hypothetical protein